MPSFAIKQISPTVFRVTVFPPVFEPVIKRDLKFSPNSKSFLTKFSLFLIRGWNIECNFIIFLSVIIAGVEFVLIEYFAFAKIKSASFIELYEILSSFLILWNSEDSSAIIFSISASILHSIALILLFILTKISGSIKNVWLLAETSWTIPLTFDLSLAFTWKQVLPILSVTIVSCRYDVKFESFNKLSIVFLRFWICAFNDVLKFKSSTVASSLIL